MRYFALIVVFALIVGAFPLSAVAQSLAVISPNATSTAGDGGDALREKIKEKATILEAIDTQREAIQKNLDEISGSANSLKNEVRAADANLSQLELTIQSNEVTIDKLGLELEALHEEIPKIEESILNAKETMKKLLVEMQEREHENLLITFLKNQSLSDSVGALQTITALNERLYAKIGEYRELQGDLADRIDETKQTKSRTQVAQVNLSNRQAIVSEVKAEKERLLEETKNREQIYQQQLDQLKELQSEISKEIDAYESELRRTIDKNLLPIPRPGVLLWPVNGGRETQGYGFTSFAAKNYGSKFHNGLDIGAPLGTEVFAAEKGVVINVGNQDAYRGCYRAGYGKFIVVKHENGLTSLYGHLSRQIVKIGDRVERGQVIGYVGHTGWATGNHLHFTVFATQTITPARGSLPEGSIQSRTCGPMPVGGDMDPRQFLDY